MKDFYLEIEVEDNILYISEENSSGCEYKVDSIKDIADYIALYLKEYTLGE